MRESRSKTRKVTPKSEGVQASVDELRINLSTDRVLGEVAMEIEAFSAQIGLR